MKHELTLNFKYDILVKRLPEEEVGRFLLALFDYKIRGINTEFDGALGMLFEMAKQDIDESSKSYEAKCEKMRAAGAKGGRPKKQTVHVTEADKPENQKVFSDEEKNQKVFSDEEKNQKVFEKTKRFSQTGTSYNLDKKLDDLPEPIAKKSYDTQVIHNVKELFTNESEENTPIKRKENKEKEEKEKDIKEKEEKEIKEKENIYSVRACTREENEELAESEKDEEPANGKQETKHKYGEYRHILLKDSELKSLSDKYGEEHTRTAIKWFDAYIEEKGYKCKSHYLAMIRWVFNALDRDRHPYGFSRPRTLPFPAARDSAVALNIQARQYNEHELNSLIDNIDDINF